MVELENNKKSLCPMTSVLTVALVVIVIASIVVWTNHFGKRSQADSLTGEIARINEGMQQMLVPPDDLEAEIESAQAALAAATEDFPVSINRNEVMDFIFDMADSCGVQVIPLVSEGWSDEEAGTSYRVLGFSGTVTGSMNDIINFIYELQNSSYETLTIRNVTITNQIGLYPDNPTYYNDVPVTVSLSIAVYTCPQTTYEDAV
jgi:hypothetical protein